MEGEASGCIKIKRKLANCTGAAYKIPRLEKQRCSSSFMSLRDNTHPFLRINWGLRTDKSYFIKGCYF